MIRCVCVFNLTPVVRTCVRACGGGVLKLHNKFNSVPGNPERAKICLI